MNERPGAVVDLGANLNLNPFYPPSTLNVDGSKANLSVDEEVNSIFSLNGLPSAGANDASPLYTPIDASTSPSSHLI